MILEATVWITSFPLKPTERADLLPRLLAVDHPPIGPDPHAEDPGLLVGDLDTVHCPLVNIIQRHQRGGWDDA